MFRWLTATVFGAPRSGQWPRVRREHLEREPACQACGRRKALEVHHVEPFHVDPARELDPTNLITLCGDPCHFVHGHLMGWSRTNPSVRADCFQYRIAVEAASARQGLIE